MRTRSASKKSLGLLRFVTGGSSRPHCDGILVLDAVSRRIIDVHPFMIELLRYSREEYLGKELWEIGLLKNAETGWEAFRELQQKGYIRCEDLPVQTKDGKKREVEIISNVFEENHHQLIQCNIRDITARKYAEERVRKFEDTSSSGRR